MTGYRATGEHGFALVAVLWGLAVLSIATASVLSASTQAVRREHDEWARLQAEAAAEAGLNRALLSLLDRRAESRWRVNGTPYEFLFAGRTVAVAIQEERGRIDLNEAGPGLLEGLFRSLGLLPDEAASMTERVLDWREPTRQPRPRGAKEAEYRAAGLFHGPRSGPFRSIEELKLVLGMTPDLFEHLRGAVTVCSGHTLPRTQTAPIAALRALPGMDAMALERLIAEREKDGKTYAAKNISEMAFAVSAEVAGPAGPIRREEVVRITSNPSRPVVIQTFR